MRRAPAHGVDASLRGHNRTVDAPSAVNATRAGLRAGGGLGYDPCPDDCPAALHVPHYSGPLLTHAVFEATSRARRKGQGLLTASFDLGASQAEARLEKDHWELHGQRYPYPEKIRERSIHYFDGEGFANLSRFGQYGLIKLVPTDWGVPTFEIDGIKMLPSAKISPLEDARTKVALVQPAGKVVLDTCGGMGYFARACLEAGVLRIHSTERNEDVLWLRRHNPWSPDPDSAFAAGRLLLRHGDVTATISAVADASVDAVLHDPPRFGIAGELYSLAFYQQLARVIRPGGKLFHYTGSPNRLTSGRDVPAEVVKRLEQAGFRAEKALDGVFAVRR